MTITHHPEITTLMAFSAGSYDEAYTTVIATHLAMSEGARETLRRIDAIGGAVLEAEESAPMSAGATDRLMGALDTGGEPIVVPPPPDDHDLPLPLRPYLPDGLDSVRWRWTGPGVATADLQNFGSSRLMLLRVGAGRRVPEHGHGGHELTLILRGAYRDRFGLFARGDIADHDEDVEHQPIAEPGDDCICLVAVDARLTFRGKLMRLFQPLFGL